MHNKDLKLVKMNEFQLANKVKSHLIKKLKKTIDLKSKVTETSHFKLNT